MAFFPSSQPPFFHDNDTENIMSSSNSTYFREDNLTEIETSWNDKIDPLLQSYSNQGPQSAYHYQQQQRLQSFIDAPPQRALFTAPSYNPSQYAQGVQSLPQASLPHTGRNISPAPSQDFTSSTSTSGHSPDGEPDLYYSPRLSHLQGGDDFLLRQGGYLQHDIWSGNGAGNGLNYHVNMSQVQSFPDALYEPGTDEGFIERHNHLSVSKGEAHYPSEIHTHSNYTEEHIHSQGQENETYYRHQTDEALGTSINSPADSTTAYDQEEEDDEEYTPKTRSRKRAATSHSYTSQHHQQPSAKRNKVSKPKSKSKSTTKGTLQCATCPLRPTFNTTAALARHVATAHTRPYTCVFSFAGCISTFASKNEWKRHVSSQHLCLTTWVCKLGQCGKSRSGSEFNRKDLFTQHCRRMHAPPSTSLNGNSNSGVKGKGKDVKWEEELQKKCLMQKREAPRFLRCPVRRCDSVFEGKDAWNERMEHVGQHLDKASGEGEEDVVQGGEGDELLVEWAVEKGVVFRLASGRYGFAKDSAGYRVVGGNGSVRGGSADVDAEGELDEGY